MKKLLLWVVILITLIFWYSLVLADLTKSPLKLELIFKSWNNIFLDSKDLNFVIVSYSSNTDISAYRLHTVCNSETTLLSKKNNQFTFKLRFLNKLCSNNNIVLKDNKWNFIPWSLIKLRLIKNSDLYSTLLDYSDLELKNIYNEFQNGVKKYMIFSNYEETKFKDTFSFLKKSRIYKEYLYNSKIILNIITSRQDKYISPVKNYKFSSSHSKLPNASRWYRESYTDWIHHWWDINAPYWTDVIALDHWLVVRVVDNFKASELSNIKRGKWLTYLEELNNLDILRWNQVWIKTMKWEVVFYSHLSNIWLNIEEWSIISKWEILWQIWISWVPGNNYKDYHLHFAIHENPYIKSKAWKYSYNEYMAWDWKFKWEKANYVLKNNPLVFE